jgi:hypothetical protein
VLAAGLAAAPDFSTTTIAVSPATPLEGDLVEFTVVVRNAGADGAEFVYITADWPRMGFLVETTGTDGAEFDHDARRISFSVPLGRGGEWPFTVKVLAPRDSGGDTLALAVRALHGPTMTEHWAHADVSIDTRPSTTATRLGGLAVARAGVVVLAVLAGGVMLWLALAAMATRSGRHRSRPAAAAVAITIAVGFWTLFASMAWRDYQSLTTWTETTCTVLGGRLSAQGTTRVRRGGSTATYVDETTFVPVLGLKYAAGGREMYSSGFDTGSRLGVGSAGGRTGELDAWNVGAVTPCWFDPAEPHDVVVIRGFGGAYLFAVFPLPVFIAGVAIARRR